MNDSPIGPCPACTNPGYYCRCQQIADMNNNEEFTPDDEAAWAAEHDAEQLARLEGTEN